MLIETFEKLWKQEHPNGKAWVPNKYGTDNRKNNVVCVTFNENSKVYTYKGTILQVATRLDLVPEIDVVAESEKLADEIRNNGFTVGHSECYDTIVYLLQDVIPTGKCLNDDFYDSTLKDEFGRKLVKFEIGDSGGW